MNPIFIPALISTGSRILNNLTSSAPKEANKSDAASFAAALEKAEASSPTEVGGTRKAAKVWLERLSNLAETQRALGPQQANNATWRISADGQLSAVHKDGSITNIPLSADAISQVKQIYQEAAASNTASSNGSYKFEISHAGVKKIA